MDANIIHITIIEDLTDVALFVKETINSQDDMRCEHVFFNAEDAMQFVPQQKTDVIIVDIGLPRASGIDAITYLKSLCPNIQFCMFTVYEDDDKIFRSLQAGAKGYILKNASSEKMLTAIRELYEGGFSYVPYYSKTSDRFIHQR
ncbi:MAG: response regulator [Saprospiraceae bacterium]|nr:response regulator [Saprospiraceae bacterium]